MESAHCEILEKRYINSLPLLINMHTFFYHRNIMTFAKGAEMRFNITQTRFISQVSRRRRVFQNTYLLLKTKVYIPFCKFLTDCICCFKLLIIFINI